MGSLAVLHASQLVTLTGPKRPRVGTELSSLGIIRAGGMLIRDGQIESVGPSAEIEKDIGDGEIVDAEGRIVMPGFVDAHTHLVFAGNRLDDFERRAQGESYEQIAQACGGIWSTVEKTRAASEADLLAQARKRANWFLRCGTTTVETKSGYGLTVEDELKILRVVRQLQEQVPLQIVPTFLGAHAVPRVMSVQEYVELVIHEMLPRVAAENLAEFCDVFCERGYFEIDQSREILSAAKKRGLKSRETGGDCRQQKGRRRAPFCYRGRWWRVICAPRLAHCGWCRGRARSSWRIRSAARHISAPPSGNPAAAPISPGIRPASDCRSSANGA